MFIVGLFFEKMLLLLFLFAYGIGSVMVIGRMLYGKEKATTTTAAETRQKIPLRRKEKSS